MNGGILNQLSLEKNVEQISFYSKEEAVILNKVNEKFEKCTNHYKSINCKFFEKNISFLNSDIGRILNKRQLYINVLKRAIMQYNELGERTFKIFNGGMSNDR